MRSKRRPALSLFLFVLLAGFSGCVEPGENETGQDEADQGPSPQNDVELEDLTRCLWPKGEDLVDCENRADEVQVREPADDGICVAEYPGKDEGSGVRLQWHPQEGNHSLQYWSGSNTPVFGVVAVSTNDTTIYHNWNRGPPAGEVVLPVMPEQANVSVLVFRTWLQSGSPVPANHTFRVDWDFVEGVEGLWPVRVVKSDEDEYHLQPTMDIQDDEVFNRQWHDFMEVEGIDFHWVIGYKKLVRGDREGNTRLEAC